MKKHFLTSVPIRAPVFSFRTARNEKKLYFFFSKKWYTFKLKYWYTFQLK